MSVFFRHFVSITICGFTLLGCKVLDFRISRDIDEQRVDGNLVSGLLDGVFESPLAFDVDIEAETDARNTGPAKRVTMESITLAITDTAMPEGDEDDFNFLDSLTIYIGPADEDSDLPVKKIAELPEVPRGQRYLSIPTLSNVNLLPYADQGARITSAASARTPPDDVTFDGKYVLLVEVF